MAATPDQTVQLTAQPLTDPIYPLQNLHLLSVFPPDYDFNMSVAYTTQDKFRLVYQLSSLPTLPANGDGFYAELHLCYEETLCGPDRENILIGGLTLHGDHAITLDSADRTRVAYYTGGGDNINFADPNELDYYQEENGIDLIRSASHAPPSSCASLQFQAFCPDLTNDNVRLVPSPLQIPLDDTAAVQTLQPLFPTVPPGDLPILAVVLRPFLDRQSQVPIDAFSFDAALHETMTSGRSDGSVSYVEDILRGVIARQGRVLLKRQANVCVPIPASDLQQDPTLFDVCSEGRRVAWAHPQTLAMSLDPVEQDPDASGACPATTPDSLQPWHLRPDTNKCVSCPDGAMEKRCDRGNVRDPSSNITCMDPIANRQGFACPVARDVPQGVSRSCERIRTCGSSSDCATGNVCQGGQLETRMRKRGVSRAQCARAEA